MNNYGIYVKLELKNYFRVEEFILWQVEKKSSVSLGISDLSQDILGIIIIHFSHVRGAVQKEQSQVGEQEHKGIAFFRFPAELFQLAKKAASLENKGGEVQGLCAWYTNTSPRTCWDH